MFKDKLDIRAVQPDGIFSVCSVDMFRTGEWFAEVTTYEVFIAQFCSEGSTSERPVKVGIEVSTIDVSAMIVEGLLVGCATEELKAVHAAVPVDGRMDVEAST